MSDQKCCGVGGDISNIPIRTLHIEPINADMNDDQIKTYFEQFGKVNSVEILKQKNAHTLYGLIEFNTVEAAAAVLSVGLGVHCFDGNNVQVKAAKPWHQPDHILNALNNDCLRAILSYLDLSDLANAANVCIRFNQEAKSVFSVKYKGIDLSKWSRKDGINILQTFGSLAQSINVESGDIFHADSDYEIKILSMIDRHCTSALKELTLRTFWFRSVPNNMNLGSAFSKLEKLKLYDCHLTLGFFELISACVELKVLHAERSFHAGYTPNIPKLDQLNELRLIDTPGADGEILNGLSCDFINRVIGINVAIKKLSLVGYQLCDTMPIEPAQAIVQSLPNLLELNLLELELNIGMMMNYDVFAQNIGCLGQLSSLKVLKLDLNWKSATPLDNVLMSNVLSIEHIKLSNGKIHSETVKAISQMKYLKVLELCNINGLTDEHMIKFANGLGSRLETLRLESSTAKNLTTIGLKKMLPFVTKLTLLTLESTKIELDADDYKVMLQTLKKRPEKIMLSFELIGGKIEVLETDLIKYRDTFFISVKTSQHRIHITIESDDYYGINNIYPLGYNSN